MKKILFLLLISLSAKSQVGFFSSSYVPQRAINFYTATSITANADRCYIYYLSKVFDGNNRWSDYLAIYPFVGGTATTHSYNLVNTSQYQITWFGGMTHNSTGVASNGTNGYGNTGLNTNVTGAQNVHLSIYSRTNTTGNIADIGTAGGTARNLIYARDGFSYAVSGSGAADSAYIYATPGTNATSKAFFLLSRTSSTLAYLQINNSIYSQRFTSNATSLQSNLNVFICAANVNGSPLLYTTRNYAFASIGNGLTYANGLILSRAVEYGQTILSRAN